MVYKQNEKSNDIRDEFSNKAYETKRSLTEPNMETPRMNRAKLKVKAIIFDLDGTIVNSREAYIEAAKAAFRAMGLEPPTTQKSLQIPKRLEQNLPISDLAETDTSNFLDVYLKTFYALTTVKTKPLPNIRVALTELQQKAKLAIITMRNVSQAEVEKDLHHFGLAQHFTYILTSKGTHKTKPSPEALFKALEVLEVETCDCLVVGDSVNDITAGKAAGTKTIAVLSGLYTKQELAKSDPDLILRDVSQLPSFIS